MRLAVDLRCLQDKTRTGVGEYAWQVLKYLSLDPSISLSGFANATGRIDWPPELARIAAIKRGRIPNKLMNLLFWLKLGSSIDKILKSDTSKIDALWLPNPSFINVSENVPVLLTVHDLSFIHYPGFFPGKGKLWYFPAVHHLLNKGLPARSLVAAVSQHTADDLIQEFPHLKNKVRVVPPGLDDKYFHEPTANNLEDAKQKYGLPENFLLSLGTIEPRKNYHLLLLMYEKLLELHPDFPYDLVIAGGWGWRYQSIKRTWARLKSRQRIKFIGYVADEDKPALYRLAEIFLFPSLYEGIGLPPLEAMAAGTPVIASHSSSLPEVIGQAGVLLSPYLVDSWVYTTNWLVNDISARQELKQKGLIQAKQFSWQKTASVYKGLFSELAAKS